MLDLPKGFSYRVVSRAGEPMADGLLVPGAHDGMAVFAGSGDRVTLICNHELTPDWSDLSGFADRYKDLPEATRRKLYDRGGDITPGLGGTTTTIFNTASGADRTTVPEPGGHREQLCRRRNAVGQLAEL